MPTFGKPRPGRAAPSTLDKRLDPCGAHDVLLAVRETHAEALRRSVETEGAAGHVELGGPLLVDRAINLRRCRCRAAASALRWSQRCYVYSSIS